IETGAAARRHRETPLDCRFGARLVEGGRCNRPSGVSAIFGTIVLNTATESFAQLFEESLSKQEMRAGEVITAEVVRIDHNFVVVNAGLKSESFVPIEEFYDDRGLLDVKEGDFVSVAIEALEDGYGETRL